MNIEFAKIEHSEELCRLVLSATQELRGLDFNEDGWNRFINTNTALDFEKKLSSPEFLIICCIESTRILGFIAIKDLEKVDQLFVLPEARRRGIAALLWEAAKNTALKKGAAGNFWVRSSSVAIPAYKKFGFESEGERQVFGGIGFQLMRLKANT